MASWTSTLRLLGAGLARDAHHAQRRFELAGSLPCPAELQVGQAQMITVVGHVRGQRRGFRQRLYRRLDLALIIELDPSRVERRCFVLKGQAENDSGPHGPI